MSDLTSICGQVQGLSPQLLQRSHIDRMVGAPKAEDAFRVLSELQYAEYIDQQTTISDFDAIITQGLYETKTLITSGTDGHCVDSFLTLPFDINNLKQALKQKLVEEKTEFEVSSSFSKLGNLSATEIQKIVFDNVPASSISEVILTAVSTVISKFNKDSSVRDIEFALDNALFSALADALVTEAYSDNFLQNYLALWADSVQIRNIARSVLIMQETLPQAAFVPGSAITFESAGKAETFADFKKVLEHSQFRALLTSIDDSATPTQQLLALEKALDKAVSDCLHNAALGSLSSPAILLDYFSKRLQNARVLKLVMYGKLNGVETDKIYKLIETV
jgi:vacuolar-type H+-ATPase subunit C/Vma6